ncbi:MAG TPA: DUF3011 domain-containing protein [Longimicrobium sp.]|jgi:hypothetical protein|uniref:DUF3011 domain-containing protein n=1 Tax=Longimicrobium sp. TaxID=2029185 RepID=UPI002ED87061
MIRKTAFAVLSLAFAALASAAPQRLEAQQTVTCESRNNDRTYCSMNARGNVHLVRQMSEAACVAGRSWGTDSRGIWVARGCRAQFVVNSNPVSRREGRVYDDGRRDGRDDDRDGRYENRGDNRATRAEINQAQRVCRNAARNRSRNSRGANVSTSYQGMDRSGQYVVRWNSSTEAGTCRVNRSGQLVNLRVSRR